MAMLHYTDPVPGVASLVTLKVSREEGTSHDEPVDGRLLGSSDPLFPSGGLLYTSAGPFLLAAVPLLPLPLLLRPSSVARVQIRPQPDLAPGMAAAARAAGALAVALVLALAGANSEGDALSALRRSLRDPGGVLQSWDPTLVNPCTWFHVTCDRDNRVTRLDLGNLNLSGHLVPELGKLEHLQYLRLNGNRLTGAIPRELAAISSLKVVDVSSNDLCGTIPTSGPFERIPLSNFEKNPRLEGPELQGLAIYDTNC
nr:unnamed protein product [Digitaria exilis]